MRWAPVPEAERLLSVQCDDMRQDVLRAPAHGIIPATESAAEEPVVDVYTYLWIEKDDTTVTDYNICVWNYGLNYT